MYIIHLPRKVQLSEIKSTDT